MRIQTQMALGIAAVALAFSPPLDAQRGRGAGPGARPGGVNPGGAPPSGMPQTGHSRSGGGPVAGKFENSAAASQRAQSMLPPGTDAGAASASFRSQKDFLSALHAARSLDVPFEDVKRKMTAGRGMALDGAMRSLRPDLPADIVRTRVTKAERLAEDDLRTGGKGVAGRFRDETPVSSEIRENPGLTARIAPLLPAGFTMDQASAGFRNTGQFVAALHAAKNLNIPFSELRARMIAGGESLGEAIHGVRPAMERSQIDAAVQSAEQTAGNELQSEAPAASAERPDRRPQR